MPTPTIYLKHMHRWRTQWFNHLHCENCEAKVLHCNQCDLTKQNYEKVNGLIQEFKDRLHQPIKKELRE